jgi:hypothetical protein
MAILKGRIRTATSCPFELRPKCSGAAAAGAEHSNDARDAPRLIDKQRAESKSFGSSIGYQGRRETTTLRRFP